ncbi:pectinesterase inhibitor domain containing protein [Panicum miliaceum]|uniref:Pectinesterase inhibitor domain containing protein n=1 Tax=Panicum miliaceum TaxID=4540 RepID=A0A3L6TA19_PANMI|nr:pectinesterase inhibitor domain containing protein [Panicum miliaceum]
MAFLQAFLCATTLLLLVPHARTTSTTLVQDQCERYAAGDRTSYDYCVWKLGRDEGSDTADARGLAAVAARMARASAKATGDRIGRMQANETVPARRDCLAACAAEYAAAVRRLGRAARGAARGGGADLQRAQTLLAVAAGTPARCDAAFAAAGQHSPLAGADRGLDDEIELALSLLPSKPPAPPARP